MLEAFLAKLAETEADAFIITGDIAEADDTVIHLHSIAELVDDPTEAAEVVDEGLSATGVHRMHEQQRPDADPHRFQKTLFLMISSHHDIL